MFKKIILLFMLFCCLSGCQAKKEPIEKSCSLMQNGLSTVVNAISDDHERVTRIEAEIYLQEDAMVFYGFGDYETAPYQMESNNMMLDEQESDGYELELIHDGISYVLKMNINLDELDEETKAKLLMNVDEEVFDWDQFFTAIIASGGSCN